MLARLRSALRDVPPGESLAVPRGYDRTLGLPAGEVTELFAERVAEYRAEVRRCTPEDLAALLAERCAGRRLGVPPHLPAAWRPAGAQLVEDHGLTAAELDALDGALTGCALGIAETGTIALDGGPRSGRRALTLVPDLHICVVEADQLVGTVPEALEGLAAAAHARRPVTFVSGPSATSDIELQRVEGVHGPRTLEVVVVG
jgi:L-lactate dehydrogenase complex protein LldG